MKWDDLEALFDRGDVLSIVLANELMAYRAVDEAIEVARKQIRASKCQGCGAWFVQRRSNQIYCSKKCGLRVASRKYRERKR